MRGAASAAGRRDRACVYFGTAAAGMSTSVARFSGSSVSPSPKGVCESTWTKGFSESKIGTNLFAVALLPFFLQLASERFT